ncbi:MAG: hypothetical protein N3D84_01585 [Candidatus Woesearchaeota archaeon]|nr:hypothetical protein [Candidatus Woesearchaeota archaeon]
MAVAPGKKHSLKELEALEREEISRLRKIEHEIHYGTKELITGILIGFIIGFFVALIFF